MSNIKQGLCTAINKIYVVVKTKDSNVFKLLSSCHNSETTNMVVVRTQFSVDVKITTFITTTTVSKPPHTLTHVPSGPTHGL